MIQEAVVEECGSGTTMRVGDLIQKGIHIVGMTVSMAKSETDMKVPGERLAGLTGTMADGNGETLHEGTVSLVLDVINLHHPQCL